MFKSCAAAATYSSAFLFEMHYICSLLPSFLLALDARGYCGRAAGRHGSVRPAFSHCGCASGPCLRISSASRLVAASSPANASLLLSLSNVDKITSHLLAVHSLVSMELNAKLYGVWYLSKVQQMGQLRRHQLVYSRAVG